MPKTAETIASNSRLTLDEARKLVALARQKGWLKLRPDAHVVQFSAKGTPKAHRPASSSPAA